MALLRKVCGRRIDMSIVYGQTLEVNRYKYRAMDLSFQISSITCNIFPFLDPSIEELAHSNRY